MHSSRKNRRTFSTEDDKFLHLLDPQPAHKLLVINAPAEYKGRLETSSRLRDVIVHFERSVLTEPISSTFDIVQVFVTRWSELESLVPQLKGCLDHEKPASALWISFPSRLDPTPVAEYVAGQGFVVSVLYPIDERWIGMRFYLPPKRRHRNFVSASEYYGTLEKVEDEKWMNSAPLPNVDPRT